VVDYIVSQSNLWKQRAWFGAPKNLEINGDLLIKIMNLWSNLNEWSRFGINKFIDTCCQRILPRFKIFYECIIS